MAENFLYNRLIQEFRSNPVLTRDDLLKFFRQYDPELSEATFIWRIFDLKRRNIIADLKKGIYTLNDKDAFAPSVTQEMISINKLIIHQYALHFYNVWDTIWLNDLMELQAISSQIVLEMEKGLMESVFFFLKDKGFAEVFIKPDENIMARDIYRKQGIPLSLSPSSAGLLFS